MRATLKIEMDNAAFGDEPGLELARILMEVAYSLESNGLAAYLALNDINGNKVGELKIIGK